MNSLEALMQNVILPMTLPHLRENTKMASLVHRNIRDEAKKRGDTVEVPMPLSFGDPDDVNTTTGVTATAIEPVTVPVKMDQWKHLTFQMDDKELNEHLQKGSIPNALQGAARSLANKIDADLLALYKTVPGFSGSAGTTPSAASDITDVRKILQKNAVPPGDRRLVLDVDAEAKFLNTFKDADATGSTEALREASLGRKFGMEIYADQLIGAHTHGTFCAIASPKIMGNQAAGATTIAMDGGAGTETLKKGDLFSVDGVKGQFVVTADAVAAGGAIASVSIFPEVPAGGFPNDADILFVSHGSGSYVNNLAFHKDAFALVVRPLEAISNKSSDIASMVDPVSGLSLRLETWREPGKKSAWWTLDILYGLAALDPKRAARMLG